MHVLPEQTTQRTGRSALFSLLFSILLIGIVVGVWNMVSHHMPSPPTRSAATDGKIKRGAFFKPTAMVTPTTRIAKLGLPLTQSKAAIAQKTPADQILAEVNGVAIPEQVVETVLNADQAVAQLLNTPFVSDRAAILERVINDAVVQQTAQLAGVTLEQTTVEQRLQAFLATNQKSEADLSQALAQVKLTRAEFENYFAHLLLVDTFVRAQAEKSGLSVADYMRQVQQSAQISFGPAAALAFATPSGYAQAGQGTTVISETVKTLTPNRAIPSFAVPILNATTGSTLTQASLLGHPTVLSFWATWCPYCRRQTPILVAAQAQYAKQGIQFIGINGQEQPDFVRAYLKANRITYPIGLDSDRRVANAFNVAGFPTTYFLDSQGHIVARHVGALTTEKLAEYLQQLINAVH